MPSPEPTVPSETPEAEQPQDSAAGPVPAPTSPFSEAADSDDRQAESPAEGAQADSEASVGFATKAVLGTSLLIAMGIGLGGWLRFSRVD